MISETDVNNVFDAVEARLAAARRKTASTYRLQFNSRFTFRDAARLVPYLCQLGITHVYASPYFKARPGSLHGYDITDHNRLNPEIGSSEDYENFVRKLHEHNMGQILDFVPNHMSIFDNPWWWDVLENGPGSPYSSFFDIDWYPQWTGMRERILLPILEDHYGRVLEQGRLRLRLDAGAFTLSYGAITLPIDPKTTTAVLEPCAELIESTLGSDDPVLHEMQSIATACRNLPARSEAAGERVLERQRERTIVKSRLAQLCERSSAARECLEAAVSGFNGRAGESKTFDRLHGLLENQTYRLSYWRTASGEINYRRFLDINDLVALRVEDPRVFDATHGLLLRLLAEGAVDGVRIDHIDGLFHPQAYLDRLQKAYFRELCWNEARRILGLSEGERRAWDAAAAERSRDRRRSELWVIVEKILTEEESLREDWPVDGTTGYEFANALNGLFVNRRNRQAINNVYRWFTGIDDDFRETTYKSRILILETSMGSELAVLAHQLQSVAERSRTYRDFTLNSLKDGISEVIACLPVYRTYVDAFVGLVKSEDAATIRHAVTEARKRNPAVPSPLFDFIEDMLLLKYPDDLDAEGRLDQQYFAMRFQQLTGPIMAKGTEDTAFYVHVPLSALNDVGGNPDRFGTGVDEFHRNNLKRKNSHPYSLVCTSTHDSKMSEDVRARLDVLSEIPQEWKEALARWRRLNSGKASTVNGVTVPDRNAEYLIYQALLGTFPAQGLDANRDGYTKRVQAYIMKAVREAKAHTSWISPDAAYEKGVSDFISALLAPPPNPFLSDFARLCQTVALCGMYNSLAQVLLKVLSPGVPDIYQGNETWNFALVDPDNRAPVDFDLRTSMLSRLGSGTKDLTRFVSDLVSRPSDGAIKMYITSRALDYRRAHAQLFKAGIYFPVTARGLKARHVCSFGLLLGARRTIVIAPRLMARLTRLGAIEPMAAATWGDTSLVLPRRFAGTFRDIFTGALLTCATAGKRPTLPVAEVLHVLPVAALESI